ncbi:hypothetical protein AAFN46_15425 [Pseudomonas sp. CAU 1711]|uniref:hypothetical protein n=1 Tax=Pseudomonas sp. CAU 1711 TaxID=3140356 RepID=UPI00326103B6
MLFLQALPDPRVLYLPDQLRQGLQAGYPDRPAVLERVFNSRYWGRSVAFQAVSRWLRGQSIPSQE